jgi:phenylacetate-CoA ligase
MSNRSERADKTRRKWAEVLMSYHEDRNAPVDERVWSKKDTWSRARIRDVQDEKIRAVAPFLYENSPFYRRRFDALGLVPSDLRSVDDLVAKWPVVTKAEMMDDVTAHPPYGGYTACSDEEWNDRGWMLFSSSGSTGVPRVFRYTHFDRLFWEQANARALYAGGLRNGDSILMLTGYGPHVFAWGAQSAFAAMKMPTIPSGGLDAKARVQMIERFKPTTLLCAPSYALYLARVMQDIGLDPADSSVKWIISGGEPFSGISGTLERIQGIWGARIIEFYGCTEASPHCGGYSCPESQAGERPFIHLMEDIQVWETVDPNAYQPVRENEKGLTVCTNLNSESSPQLRFLVGDYTELNYDRCGCGRSHVRGMGCIVGRSDDLINLRGIKFFPTQIEEAVRAVPATGDEFQIRLETRDDGLDVMTLVVEHPSEEVSGQVADEVRRRCEVRSDIKIVPIGTLPKTEHKSKRVVDLRIKN